jgi:hypothetical protein
MNSADYHRFSEELRSGLQQDERVLGLVALGSMAEWDYLPDAWSDHDFFVVTQPGTQEAFRNEWLAGQFLTALLVGVGRYRRGERLSGRELVKAQALRHLLVLLARHRDSPRRSLLDDLDPFRRFEGAFPTLGQELDSLLDRETTEAARILLALALRELPGILPEQAVEAIRQRLA